MVEAEGACGPSRRRIFFLLALAVPIIAAKPSPPPPPLPPLPPLILDAAAPVIIAEIAGQPVRLRVDPGSTRFVELNASAAGRLDLANPARLVGERPADLGLTRTEVGKIVVKQQTSEEPIAYAGRILPLSVAWGAGDPVQDADGTILPIMLPQDEVRFVRRPPGAGDVTATLPLRWEGSRGLLATIPAGGDNVDVIFRLTAPESVATTAAAAFLGASNGGRLTGPDHQALILHGVSRPVRGFVFIRPVIIGPLKIHAISTRLFDWSGKLKLPADATPDGDLVVIGKLDAQRSWPMLVIGSDHLASCAEIVWRRIPLEISLTCPAAR